MVKELVTALLNWCHPCGAEKANLFITVSNEYYPTKELRQCRKYRQSSNFFIVAVKMARIFTDDEIRENLTRSITHILIPIRVEVRSSRCSDEQFIPPGRKANRPQPSGRL
jgi:hypothetical protein